MRPRRILAAASLSCFTAAIVLFVVDGATAHCDTMDGPIVPEAQLALASGAVTPLFKWIPERDELALQQAFDRARDARTGNDAARELADQFFLETLIRIHREGEGECFTGLKPAGSAPLIFRRADAALEEGSVDVLADELAEAVRAEIHLRFSDVERCRRTKDSSVEAGREYVDVYVEYMHFVERLHTLLSHGSVRADDGHFGAGLAHD